MTTKHTLDELKRLIAAKLEVDEVLDILGFDLPELLDVLEDYVADSHEDFEEAL